MPNSRALEHCELQSWWRKILRFRCKVGALRLWYRSGVAPESQQFGSR
jgi:hypothetical protein